MNEQAPGNHAKSSVLHTLASSGNQFVQLGTLALVAISGLTSFFQTSQVGEEGKRDRDKAIEEIHHLYARVDDFERRQKQNLEIQHQIMDSNSRQMQNQTQMLQNQNGMLNNQENVLKIMRENQQRALQNFLKQGQQPGP